MISQTREAQKQIPGHFKCCLVYALSILFALATPISFAQSALDSTTEHAGKVIVASGDVLAQDSDGNSRTLSRNSLIYVGDTIFTAVAASTQIRMIDEALIALKESTEFAIVAYQYEQIPGTDASTIELIQGGFRTITGNIGKQNKQAYEARIGNFATIGIRGTDYEAVITPAGGVLTAVWDGGTTISNGANALDLGLGAAYDFAQVVDQDTPPEGLLLQPAGLGDIPVVTVENNEDADNTPNEDVDSGNDADDSSADPEDSDDSAVAASPQLAGSQNSNNSANSSSPGLADSQDSDDSAVATSPQLAGSQNSNNSANSSSPGLADSQNSDDSAIGSSPQLEAPSATLIAKTATATTSDNNEIRRGDQESSRTEITVNPSETGVGDTTSCATNSDQCLQLATEKITEGNNGNGNSSNKDNNNSDKKNEDSDDNSRSDDDEDDKGNSSDKDNSNSDKKNEDSDDDSGSDDDDDDGNSSGKSDSNSDKKNQDSDDNSKSDNNNKESKSSGKSAISSPAKTLVAANINWGKWDNPVDSNWVVVQRVDDELVRISSSNYFADVNPTPVANLTGSHSYATGIASSFIGSGSAGDISSLNAGMDVNFDTGVIANGSLDVLAGDQTWSVNFEGLVQAGAVDLNMIQSQLFDSSGVISNVIDGNLDGVFTGNKAEAFLGGFDLLDAINPNNNVDGLFTIER